MTDVHSSGYVEYDSGDGTFDSITGLLCVGVLAIAATIALVVTEIELDNSRAEVKELQQMVVNKHETCKQLLADPKIAAIMEIKPL